MSRPPDDKNPNLDARAELEQFTAETKIVNMAITSSGAGAPYRRTGRYTDGYTDGGANS
jgi:hypothetical protein